MQAAAVIKVPLTITLDELLERFQKRPGGQVNRCFSTLVPLTEERGVLFKEQSRDRRLGIARSLGMPRDVVESRFSFEVDIPNSHPCLQKAPDLVDVACLGG